MDRKNSIRFIPLLTAAATLSACGGIIPAASPPSSSASSASASDGYRQAVYSSPAARISSAPREIAPRSSDRTCHAQLTQTGARFAPVPDSYSAPGCNKIGTVRISALSGDRGQFGVTNLGAVKCQTATAFSNWARFGVDRAARQILGSQLAKIETMGSYACRNIAGSSRRSAHSQGAAIDVSGFVLEDGRRIVLTEDWNGGTAAEREFLRVVHKSACKRFGTVLGPDYNAAHRDHFHFESSDQQFCR